MKAAFVLLFALVCFARGETDLTAGIIDPLDPVLRPYCLEKWQSDNNSTSVPADSELLPLWPAAFDWWMARQPPITAPHGIVCGDRVVVPTLVVSGAMPVVRVWLGDRQYALVIDTNAPAEVLAVESAASPEVSDAVLQSRIEARIAQRHLERNELADLRSKIEATQADLAALKLASTNALGKAGAR